MRYIGGKTKISKWVAEYVLNLGHDKTRYLEPFVGSGATFAAISQRFDRPIAADCHPDLILMWQAIASGWTPPENITREEYKILQGSKPSALRGLVGFGASFGGKWFGGFADTPWDSHWQRFTKPFYCAARSSVLKLAPIFARADIRQAYYWDHEVDSNTLIYCDPPYAGTQGYSGTPEFDSKVFWEIAESWHLLGARVIVSEYQAPTNWRCLAVKNRKTTLAGNSEALSNSRQEMLWTL